MQRVPGGLLLQLQFGPSCQTLTVRDKEHPLKASLDCASCLHRKSAHGWSGVRRSQGQERKSLGCDPLDAGTNAPQQPLGESRNASNSESSSLTMSSDDEGYLFISKKSLHMIRSSAPPSIDWLRYEAGS
jgi:hypothetical protein